jgi:hypothetical protein
MAQVVQCITDIRNALTVIRKVHQRERRSETHPIAGMHAPALRLLNNSSIQNIQMSEHQNVLLVAFLRRIAEFESH